MNRPGLRSSLLACLAGSLLPCLSNSLWAQEPAAAPPEPKQADTPAEAIRELTIYIPYEKLRKVFEKEGRGVFLPYEKFRQLWDAAREKTAPQAEHEPPAPAVITEVDSEAIAAKDVVRVAAKVKVDLLREGWLKVPLRLSDAAITKSAIADQPARIIADAGGGYYLLLEKKGKQPESITLDLEYAKAITRQPGQNSVVFQAPQAPVSRWRVRIPEPGVKVELSPLIAATEVPGAGAPQGGEAKPAEKNVEEPKVAEKPPAEETVVLAFVGAAPTVRIQWTPKAEGATGLEALVSVAAEQEVWINEGVTRSRAQLAYTISRAELGQLAIEAPADYKVTNVFDANVRQWSVEQADKLQKINVQLFEPAKAGQSVVVELEKFAGEEPQRTVAVPVVKAIGVGRQQGLVVVQAAEGLRAEVANAAGLLQIDASELPETLRRTAWNFAYRYAAAGYQLAFDVEKVQPRIRVDSLVEFTVRPERAELGLLAIYDIQRAGVFQLELDVPAGYQVRQVEGRPAPGAEPVQVDTHHLERENKTRLVVNLGRKAMGKVALGVQLQKDLQEPDLLGPTGKAVTMPVEVPRPVSTNLERATGRLIVYAPESLRVNPATSDGLRAISFEEALAGMEAGRQAQDAARPVLAFAFTQEPMKLELAAERRKPQVTVGQLLVARVDEGVVKYEATFFYSVLYSGVKSLRLDLPAEVASAAHNMTPAIREKTIEPPPADLAKGYVAWSLSGETERIGDGSIRFVWEKKLDGLDVGSQLEFDVPVLVPRGVDRAWGQIVLTKAETVDLQTPDEPKGLRPIDPQHDLMPGASVSDAARAFEFHDDWALAVTATRYQLEEIKHTSVERAVVRAVVTRGKNVKFQALFRMRSVRQRLVVQLPQGSTVDMEPRIDGRPTTLEQGQDRQYFIPLVESGAEKPFVLELRYTVQGDGRTLELAEFPLEPAVQKVYLCVYLPEEWAILERKGPWTEEFRWRLDDNFTWKPASRLSDQELVAWVCERLDVADSFPTDGRCYVFSTLSPLPPPAGDLQLRWIEEDWLNAIVFAAVVLLGIFLIPAGAGVRGLALGALVIAAVALGVFYPILAWQMLDGVLAAGLLVVLVLWILVYFLWTRRRNSEPELPGEPWPDEWPGLVTPAVPPVAAEAQAAIWPSPAPSTPETEKPPESRGEEPPRDESGRQQGGQDHA
ncbi:MAG: hypothetical protein HUU20_16005 [Pirellulales bacterium]|nr:hypothetical protein [Pirellulales bacterium]